ncbi:hypothetical protein QQ045_006960 [Rhodiola kirilowii]
MGVLQLGCVDSAENRVSSEEENGIADVVGMDVPARRRSARVKELIDQKGKGRVSLADVADSEFTKPKKMKAQLKRKVNGVEEKPKAKRAKRHDEVGGGVDTVKNGAVRSGLGKVENGAERSGVEMVENGAERSGVMTENRAEKSHHALAKDTLRSFNKYYLHFIQEEEKRCQKVIPVSKSKNKKKVKVAAESETKSKAKRPDLKAITQMKKTNSILFPERRIGDIPGIDVGYQFFSRAEMVVVGFHSHWLNGIDYMGQAYRKVYKDYTFPLATAIVISGQYEDDLDNSEDVIYTGQGGNNLLGNKRQVKDQKLVRGNLGLKNCIEHSVPVRVVRGHNCKNSYVGRVYTYDGLYKVVEYWPEPGISGFTVYKYRLRRLDGQPTLTTNQVYYAHGGVPKVLTDIRGLVCKDISGGEERIPIPATNLVDDPPVAPSGGFTYHKSMKVSKSVKVPSNKTGCNCRGACIDSRVCACAKLNGSDFPYVLRVNVNNKRSCYRLVEAKDIVYECGPGCGCGPDCVNRASQRGMEYRLEVFRTPKKGWAVRSWDFIPSGAPVCEYIGVLMKTDEADYDHDNNYIFDIDCLQTIKGLDGREKRYRNVANIELDKSGDDKSDVEYCIDAGSSGNVARFINHSCEPNLFVQCVLSSHHDFKLARIVLFAADNITPLQELTYDYGYALDSVVGPDGKPKHLDCYCGAEGCKKRLF